MQEYIFSNGLKLVLKKRESSLTSVCISINAGADMEDRLYGLAHATEHMVYKGTEKRSEMDINRDLSRIFGFNNAMTNYPYVIYYGTLLEEDFEKGLEILSDIIINPTFKEEGFKEEMDVIKEELEEWDEELEQFLEDKQFLNTFSNRRLKYPIIGLKSHLDRITLKDIKEFYNKFYFPKNATIAVVSDMEFDEVKFKVWKLFKDWETRSFEVEKPNYSDFKEGIYRNYREGVMTSKVQYIFPIDSLNEEELKTLRIFNEFFSNGINSVLYNKLRTERGLIYDVIPKISNEKNMKLYKITLGTSNEKVLEAIEVVDKAIREATYMIDKLTNEEIKDLIKSFILKKLFREEQSIVLAKELATYDTMHGNFKIYLNEDIDLEHIDKESLKDVARKVFSKKSIQIITRKEGDYEK